MLYDICYILKPDIEPDELRYSLRSVEANFPHNKVWFVCGQPKGFEPDGKIEHKQTGNSKWGQIKSSMWEIVKNPDITENFFLFNDDFFIMQPFTGEFINCVDGTLEERIISGHKVGGMNPFLRTLYKAEQELKGMRYPTMNYDVHLPMLMNKQLVRESIDKCTSPQMRSVYGNINRIPYKIHPDVKITDLSSVPCEPDFLSTNEISFKQGAVGDYIKSAFTNPSRWER